MKKTIVDCIWMVQDRHECTTLVSMSLVVEGIKLAKGRQGNIPFFINLEVTEQIHILQLPGIPELLGDI